MTEARKTDRTKVFACIILAMFVVAIEATIIATAMPAIVARLGSFELYSWVFAGFLLAQTATTVLFGKLSDLYGRRPILVGGMILFLAGSLLCGFATSMPMLILFRLIQGLGGGAILPVSATIMGDLYTPEERGAIQGYLSSVWGISAILGPAAGGLIVEHLSWPWVFWINVPIGLAAVLGLTRFLHEGIERKPQQVDYLGAFLFAVVVSAFLLVLTRLGEPGAGGMGTLIALVVFCVALPLFFLQERRAKEPMLTLEWWTDPLIGRVNAAAVVSGMTLIGLTTFLPLYVQGVLGRDPVVAGFTLTMMAVGWPLSSMLSRRFYRRFGMRSTLRSGTYLMVVGALVFVSLSQAASPILAGAGSFITGFGMGLLTTTGLLLVQGSVGWERRGSATASNVFSRNLGNTLGASALGLALNASLHSRGVPPESIRGLLEHRTAPDPAHRAAMDYGLHVTFWCVLALAIVTVAVAALIPSRELHELGSGGPQTDPPKPNPSEEG